MKTIPGSNLPQTMNALILNAFNTRPEVMQAEVPTPGKGEVLIQIHSSPVNPSDNSFLKGMYSTKKPLPVIPGFEASGKVVGSGHDFMSKRLLGKPVACFAPVDGNGTWADYMVTKSRMVIPLKKNVSLEQGSMLLVNPVSVMAMLDIAKKGGHRAIANTAAASALGQLMNHVCAEKNLPVVNIVRRKDQVELLKSQGARYVVDSSSKTYSDELSRIFSQLNVTLAFDAIAGHSTFELMDALPHGGEVMVYGGLSEQPVQTHPGKLIFESKKISGFWASEWISRQSVPKMLRMFRKIQNLIAEEHQTKIQKRVSLEEAYDGISLYLERMTAGKVLVQPGLKS
ncbi:MAG: zinc-binding dehydrogenase [Cytophagales bacterium]|nr:zinc-binding dehydrogenase [Cytophagales bacterium]